MKEIEEFIGGIRDPNARAMAILYLPAIGRWAEDQGWDVVRKWLYTSSRTPDNWYKKLLSKMNTEEHLAEDARRLVELKVMATSIAQWRERERTILRVLVTSLIGELLGSI